MDSRFRGNDGGFFAGMTGVFLVFGGNDGGFFAGMTGVFLVFGGNFAVFFAEFRGFFGIPPFFRGIPPLFSILAEPARFFADSGGMCYTFADIFNQGRKYMKNNINKTILFAAVLFAAGLSNISANAQVMTEARAQIFSDVGTQMLNGVGETRTYNFNNSMQAIVQEEGMRLGNIDIHIGFFACVAQSGGYSRATDAENDLPTFTVNCPVFAGVDERTPVAGDVFALIDNWLLGDPQNYLINVRAYTKGGTDLFVASINDVLPTATAPAFGSSAGTGFFITNDNVRTNIFAANLIGFQKVECDPGYISDDEINCRLLERNDCDNTEIFNDNMPFSCDLRTTANNDCIGDQNVVNNLCENPTCTGATPDLVNGVCVPACESDEARNADGNCEPNPANCGANAVTNPVDDTMCVCVNSQTHQFVAGSTTDCEPIPANCGANAMNDPNDNAMCVCENTQTHQFVAGSMTDCEPIPTNPNTPTCEEHEIINSSNMCVDRTAENCGNGEVFSPVNTGGVCISAAEVLATVPFISPTYTAASCENARWETGFAFSENKQEVAEVCEIPVMRNDTAAARESQPQIANGTSINGCIMRQSAGFSAENMPNCENPQLFGNGRFPVRPANFNPGDILTLTDGELSFNGVALRPESPQTQTSGGNGSGNSFIFSGIGLFWAIYSWQVGSGEFNFSPDVGYSLTESGYSANAAGQLNFRDENLHIYWRAGQQNSDGDFGDLRYESGGKYAADFWSATFTETIAGETASYDFSISADLRGGIWQISPTYRMQSEWKESDSGIKSDTQNELNLQGDFRYNNWQIRPSAGFRWENANDFSENARFKINAIHRF